MSIELVTKYSPLVDEEFKNESKVSLVTNQDYSWTGAHAVKVYSVSTAEMTDYGREGAAEGDISRYGTLKDLNATTQEMLLSKDRSFIFNIDKLDEDETGGALNSATALARQVREVVIPERDTHVYKIMTEKAGHKPSAVALTAENIYDELIKASTALDDAEVPETQRAIIVTPAVYQLMKKSKDIIMETDISAEMRLQGVIANLDGMTVQKVPANRLPSGFGFMVAHPIATVAPVKLEEYGVHSDTVLSSGDIVTGRICYDAFVLNNKAKAIYYQEMA